MVRTNSLKLNVRYTIPETLILTTLFFGLFVSTVIAGAGIVFSAVYFLQIFLAALSLVIFFDFNFLNKELPKLNILNTFTIFLVLFFVLVNIKTIDSNLSVKAVFKILSYLFISAIFFFHFAGRLYQDDRLFEKTTNLFLAAGVLIGLSSLFLLFAGINFNELYPKMATGFFMHPNTISNVYTIVIPIVLYKYFAGKISLVFAVIICLVLFLALLFTFSRAGYLGTCIALLVLTYSRSKKIFVLTIVTLIAAVYLVVFDFILSKSDSSISRFILWATAIDMVFRDTSHMLWGYGVFNALEVFQSEKFFFGSREIVPDPHNSILLLSIQFGIVFTAGVSAFILLLYLKVFLKRKSTLYSRYKNKISLSMAITLGLLGQNMVENILVYPEYFVMQVFMIFLGFIYHFSLPLQNE